MMIVTTFRYASHMGKDGFLGLMVTVTETMHHKYEQLIEVGHNGFTLLNWVSNPNI